MEGPPMTFIFHHGGIFRNDEKGSRIYEPDNTEVLVGVDGDTLDVFFVKGYYKQLGYAGGGLCWWKVPWLSLEKGLRKLETDKDLLKLCKTCRRNHNVMNIYFEHGVSEPHVVECMSEEDDVILPTNAPFLKLPSTQRAMQARKVASQPTMSHSQRESTKPLHPTPKNKAKATPNSAGPSPHHKNMDYAKPKTRSSQQAEKPKEKPNSEPSEKPTKKPISAPTRKCSSQPTPKPKQQPKFQPRSFSQPANPTTAVKVGSRHQPPTKSNSKNKNNPTQHCTRSGRAVKPPPIQDDSDSHESYESAEDSLYKPTKGLGDASDTDSGGEEFESRGTRKNNFREKHRPASSRKEDKVIDTDDSSYEDIEEDDPSDSDSGEDSGSETESDCDSWHSEDMDKVLDSDEEEPTVYPPYNEKAKFGTLKLEVSMIFKSKQHFMNATRDYTIQWGMPCMHAISCIQDKNDKRAEDYCHEWLTMESYRKTYAFHVNPVKGQELWEKTGRPAPVPPPIKPKPGRPTKNRRKDKDDGGSGSKTRMKRKYNPIRCMFCSEVGHNKRTCQKKKQADAEEESRLMQLQLALTNPNTDVPNELPSDVPNELPTDADSATLHNPLPLSVSPPPKQSNATTETTPVCFTALTSISFHYSCLVSQFGVYHVMQAKMRGRPPKLQVCKGKGKRAASPQPAPPTAKAPISVGTIRGSSAATTKKLASFMTFIPTPGFKRPRKKDDAI
ncbi:hypothetical protein Ahy_B05g073971 [Arachis hypogaea]|uniref:PB1-like domain-containing protein n=1 Tax=Arachis hypogaea TaxID=3818 RepID=A0A444YXJ1_ARAHY|nr:hypothetical protein Ahy_B05g073971 [Arachis hypogaea]